MTKNGIEQIRTEVLRLQEELLNNKEQNQNKVFLLLLIVNQYINIG